MKIIHTLSLILMLTSLSGCVPLLIGAVAGGATGYYISKDNQSNDK